MIDFHLNNFIVFMHPYVDGYIAKNLLQIAKGREPEKLIIQNEEQKQLCLRDLRLMREICQSSDIYHIYLKR